MSDKESGPCASQASQWRSCLKKADYTPDREMGDCDNDRQEFYSCVRNYRESNGLTPETKDASTIPKACQAANTEFHTCMKINSFNVDMCQKDMEKLRQCCHKNLKHSP